MYAYGVSHLHASLRVKFSNCALNNLKYGSFFVMQIFTDNREDTSDIGQCRKAGSQVWCPVI